MPSLSQSSANGGVDDAAEYVQCAEDARLPADLVEHVKMVSETAWWLRTVYVDAEWRGAPYATPPGRRRCEVRVGAFAAATLPCHFWSFCRDMVAICSSLCSETMEQQRCVTLWVTHAEAIVLGCLRERREAEHRRRCGGEGEAGSRAAITVSYHSRVFLGEESAERAAVSLLMPFLWHTLHGPPPTHRKPSAAGMPMDDFTRCEAMCAMLDLRRLHAFAQEWCHLLPLAASHVPVHRRLMKCLRASFAVITQMVSGGADPLSRAAAGLEGTLCRLALLAGAPSTPLQRFVRDFSDMLESISRTAPHSTHRAYAAPATDGASPPSMSGFTMAAEAADSTEDLPPIEMYVRCFLPCHLFLTCLNGAVIPMRRVPETRLVALTGVHVLMLHSLCTYHPRLYVHERGAFYEGLGSSDAHGTSDALYVPMTLKRFDASEKQLLEVEVGAGRLSVCESTGKAHPLLCLCWVRELRAAVAGLDAAAVDLCQRNT
jgi:hypothetical protein